jgi:hypothetical protein
MTTQIQSKRKYMTYSLHQEFQLNFNSIGTKCSTHSIHPLMPAFLHNLSLTFALKISYHKHHININSIMFIRFKVLPLLFT